MYRWLGKITELANTSEEVSLNFLSTLPKKEELQNFIRGKLTHQKDSLVKIAIIAEDEIENFMKKEKEKIASHS